MPRLLRRRSDDHAQGNWPAQGKSRGQKNEQRNFPPSLQTGRASMRGRLLLLFATPDRPSSHNLMTRHVRDEVASGQAQLVGQLPATQTLRFDIVLPLRDRAGLQNFVQQVQILQAPSTTSSLRRRRLPRGSAPARKIGTPWLLSRKRAALRSSAEPAMKGT